MAQMVILVPPGESFTVTGTPAPTVRWHVGPLLNKGVSSMPLEVSMSTEQQVRLAITPLTPGGAPAPIDGEAHWSVEGACTLMPIDATSCWCVAGTVPGDSVVTVSADADMGAGFVALADTAVIHVANPMAANLGMTADEPILQLS
jgi:hypothetical protein